MAINRNYLFLEAFSVILVFSILGNVQEFVATLISNHPHNYLYYLAVYIIVISVLLFAFYKITYRPPKYSKIVNKAQQRHDTLIAGLKSKIDTIDDNKRKKEENDRKKALKNAQKADTNTQTQKPAKKETPTLSYKTIPKNTGSKNKSTSKSKTTRRRR